MLTTILRPTLRAAPLLCAACLGFACRGRDTPQPGPERHVAVGTPSAASAAGAPVRSSKEDAWIPQFHVVARFRDQPALHKVERALFVSETNWLARISNGELVPDDSLSAWVSRRDAAWFGFQLSGTWPDDLIAAFSLPNGNQFWSRILRHTKQGWESVAEIRDTSVLAASAWSERRVLALKYPGGKAGDLFFATQFESWPPAPATPRLAPAPPTRGGNDTGADVCATAKTAIIPAAMYARTEGHVFVAGATCEQRYLAVEWFDPRSKRSRLQTLRETEARGPSGNFAARAPGDVYLTLGSIGGSVLAHYDGRAWTTLRTPFSGFVSGLDVTDNDTLYVVARPAPYRPKRPPDDKLAVRPDDEGQLWQRSQQGEWTRISLPDDIAMLHDRFHAGAHEVAAWGEHDLWLTAGTALLHSSPPSGAVRDFARR